MCVCVCVCMPSHSQSDGRSQGMHDKEAGLSHIPGCPWFADVSIELKRKQRYCYIKYTQKCYVAVLGQKYPHMQTSIYLQIKNTNASILMV